MGRVVKPQWQAARNCPELKPFAKSVEVPQLRDDAAALFKQLDTNNDQYLSGVHV